MRQDPLLQKTTRNKHPLRIALLISAVVHVAILAWVRFEHSNDGVAVDVARLDVTLVESEPEPEPQPEPESTAQEATVPDSVPTEPAPTVAEPIDEEITASLAASTTAEKMPPEPIDLQALISAYAEQAATENLEKERHREKMWRKTFSVMFAPPEEWIIEDQPYLPDLQFEADKPKRLGFKLSDNCYIGFPGIDPQSVDSDAPGWSGGGVTQPTIDLISCGFGN